MSGLYSCGVSAAIHKLLQDKGIACPHCQALQSQATNGEVK